MFTALKILQSDFEASLNYESIIPTNDNDINLVLSVDPFQYALMT